MPIHWQITPIRCSMYCVLSWTRTHDRLLQTGANGGFQRILYGTFPQIMGWTFSVFDASSVLRGKYVNVRADCKINRRGNIVSKLSSISFIFQSLTLFLVNCMTTASWLLQLMNWCGFEHSQSTTDVCRFQRSVTLHQHYFLLSRPEFHETSIWNSSPFHYWMLKMA